MEMSLYQLYKDLKVNKIMLCYCGAIAQASIEGVGDTLRKNMELEETSNAMAMTVFSIFIEQVQNVLNYSAEKIKKDQEDEKELRIGIVVIGREESGNYFIYCGNRILKQDVERISANLEFLKKLSKEELKALYKERRRMEGEPGSKGAGLGLIEMARRSSEPLQFSFEPVNDELSFFSIKVVVGR
ncbi:MAG: hypothetical protein K0S47_242 [Herbinix sp.]|jgi:superfamily II RNA helicase|nr:hypothetical protein [Herbinix sp.]